MLVIWRGIRDGLYIGGDIKIVILDVDGDEVRIGIQAPRDLIIDRAERRERNRGEDKDA